MSRQTRKLLSEYAKNSIGPPLRAAQDRKKEEVTMIQQLKNFDVDRMDIEQLVELSAVGRVIVDEFDKTGAETPEWLTTNLKSLRREIRARQADALEALLREKQSRLESLKPAEQRRADLAGEIETLKQKLAGVGV